MYIHKRDADCNKTLVNYMYLEKEFFFDTFHSEIFHKIVFNDHASRDTLTSHHYGNKWSSIEILYYFCNNVTVPSCFNEGRGVFFITIAAGVGSPAIFGGILPSPLNWSNIPFFQFSTPSIYFNLAILNSG